MFSKRLINVDSCGFLGTIRNQFGRQHAGWRAGGESSIETIYHRLALTSSRSRKKRQEKKLPHDRCITRRRKWYKETIKLPDDALRPKYFDMFSSHHLSLSSSEKRNSHIHQKSQDEKSRENSFFGAPRRKVKEPACVIDRREWMPPTKLHAKIVLVWKRSSKDKLALSILFWVCRGLPQKRHIGFTWKRSTIERLSAIEKLSKQQNVVLM
jgi:hypothetical protein